MPPRRNRNRERSAGQSSGSLSRWKLAALSVLAVVLISYLAFAQGAFSTLSASRGAEVGAASGSNALVGIEPAETILVDESSQTSGGCGIGPLVVTQGDSNTLYTVSGGQAQQYGTKGTQVQAIGPGRADLDIPDNERNEIPYITTRKGQTKLRILDTHGQSQDVLVDSNFKSSSLPTQKTLLGVGKFNSSDEDEEGESEEEEEEGSEEENNSETPEEQTLVEVTNNLNTPADIKISLVNDVESELIIDGTEAGESYTIAALAPDEQTVVNITSPEEADPGTVRFRIVATSTEGGTTITTNREVDIVSSGGEDSESAPANSNVESYIFFVDANHEGIYKITHGSDPKLIAKPGNGAQGIAGIADIDADGTTELIFGDGSQQVRYLEPNGQTSAIPNGQAGSNNGIGLGCPTDFDGDGYPSVPLVTGSNNIKIVNGYEGQKALIKKGVNARKSPITTRDIDNDGSIEIIYISSNGDLKYIDSPLSGPSVKPVDGSIQPNGATGAT